MVNSDYRPRFAIESQAEWDGKPLIRADDGNRTRAISLSWFATSVVRRSDT